MDEVADDKAIAWSLKDFVAKGMPQRAFSRMIRELRDQAEADAGELAYRTATMPRDALVDLSRYGKNGYGVSARYAPAVLQAYEQSHRAREKPADTWTRLDLIANGIPETLVDNLLKTLKEAKQSKNNPVYRGMVIPAEDIVLFGDPNAPTVGVKPDSGARIIAHVLRTDGIPKNLMSSQEMAELMGIKDDAAGAIIFEIRKGLESAPDQSYVYKQMEMPQGVVAPYYERGQLAYGIQRPFGCAIAEDRRDVERKGAGYWTATEFNQAAGIDDVNTAGSIIGDLYAKALDPLKGESENRGIVFTKDDFKHIPDIQKGMRLAVKSELARALAEMIAAEKRQPKPPGGVSGKDLMDLGIGIGDRLMKDVKQQFDDGHAKAVYLGRKMRLEFPAGAIVKYYNKGQESYCFSKDHGERIIAAYIASGRKISLEALEAKGITPPSARPLSAVLAKAEDFVHSAMGQPKPHTLFCAFLDPSSGRENSIELRMYRWGENPDGGGIIIQRPPLSRSIKTGGSLVYGAAMLSEVEDRILAIPGVQAYRKLNNRRIAFGGGDEIIPDAIPANGNGLGVIEEKQGTYHLLMKYGPPHDTAISINLGLVHTPENLEAVHQRAGVLRQHIQDLHQAGAVATRLGVTDWLAGRYPFESPYSNERVRRIRVDFPTPGASTLVIYPPKFQGTPSSMWKARVAFEFNGQPITGNNASRILSFHILDGEKTLDRLVGSARIIKRILESQATGGGQWALNDEGQLLQRLDDPARPHDVDAIRLRDICNLAARYELDHEVAEARPRLMTENAGKKFLAVTLGIRRTHRGQRTEELFSERVAPNAPAEPLERTVYIPVRGDGGADHARADAFVDRVRMSVDAYLKRDYANFNPVELRIRRPKPYQPASFRNFLVRAVDTAIGEEFKDFKVNLPPPPGVGVTQRDEPRFPPKNGHIGR
ncbi:hypothetical protein ACYOEI_09345 [Singulisphaera rosea]